ncbi:MAG: GDYXXLXY domain-containing protein [Saprospiraceae bacterium]|nr:GDYXXLXY domain-containing protein [Saprospiraceae bacterium]
MKNNATLRIGIFAAVMLLYIWFPFNMIWQTEQVLKNGTVYRFQLQPIDPYDAFRGRYVSLFYGNQEIQVSDSLHYGQEVYVTLQRDSLGFRISKMFIQKNRPNRTTSQPMFYTLIMVWLPLKSLKIWLIII